MIFRNCIIFLSLVLGISAFPQKTVCFEPVFGKEKIVENRYYKLTSGDSLKIEMLKFYVSGFQFRKNGKTVFEAPVYHLINAFDSKTLVFDVPLPPQTDFNEIAFTIGVDSLANVSGAQDGDLDATKGMYWSWQSGYVNFKIEGQSNLYKTRKNEFFFHLGGYMPPDQTIQQLVLEVPDRKNIRIRADLQKFLEAIDFGKLESIMIPGAKAAALSKRLPSMFSIE